MTTIIKALILTGLIIGFFGLMTVITWVSSSNSEISLRNKIEAQEKTCEAFYDKLWKIIKQKTGVAQEYAKTFKDIYPALIEGRYGNEKGGTLMKWITESNPTFDVSLYKDLSASIEAERTGFFMEQKKLIDLDREHKTMRAQFPASMFIGSRPDVEFTIITSDNTEQVYKTGKENDIELFDKK
jgi:hypothetical protein